MKRRGLVPVERRVSSLSTAIAVIATLLQPVLASSGFAQWSIDPFVNNAISSEADEQTYPTIASDGAGGAIITWIDGRSGDDDIYAQRIDAAGVVQWTAGGVVISTAAYQQRFPTIVSDGAGGAIITWQDLRSGTNWDIYAQRVNSAGAVQWTAGGVAISTAARRCLRPRPTGNSRAPDRGRRTGTGLNRTTPIPSIRRR